MNVTYGRGTTEYGPGVSIELTGDEVATAIDAYLVAHGARVSGARTITVNGDLCEEGHIYVDPSGFVIFDGEKYSGRARQSGGTEMSRTLTLYRDDSTVQVIYERVKAVFWTAGNTVLVVSQYTDEATDAHRYIHWPRERFCWFKDDPAAESPEKEERR